MTLKKKKCIPFNSHLSSVFMTSLPIYDITTYLWHHYLFVFSPSFQTHKDSHELLFQILSVYIFWNFYQNKSYYCWDIYVYILLVNSMVSAARPHGWSLALSITICVTLDKLLDLSEPQFPHLYNGNNSNITYLHIS